MFKKVRVQPTVLDETNSLGCTSASVLALAAENTCKALIGKWKIL